MKRNNLLEITRNLAMHFYVPIFLVSKDEVEEQVNAETLERSVITRQPCSQLQSFWYIFSFNSFLLFCTTLSTYFIAPRRCFVQF